MGVALTKDAVCPPNVQQSDYIIPADSSSACKRSKNGPYFEKVGVLRPDFPQKIPAKGKGIDSCPNYTPPPISQTFPCDTTILDFCNNYSYLQAANYPSANACITDITAKGGKLPSIPCTLTYTPAQPKIQQDNDGVWKVVENPTLVNPGVPASNCDLSQRKTPTTIDPNVLSFCSNPYYVQTLGYTSQQACISDIVNNKNNAIPKVACKTELVDDTPSVVKEGANFYRVKKTKVLNDGYPPNKCKIEKVNTPITISSALNNYCNNPYYLTQNGYGSKDECIFALIETTTLPNVDCQVTYVDDTPKYDIVNDVLVVKQKPVVTQVGYPLTNCVTNTKTIPATVPKALQDYCNNPYFLQKNNFENSTTCQRQLITTSTFPTVECEVQYVQDTPAYILSGSSYYLVKKPVVTKEGYPKGRCPTEKQLELVRVDPAITSFCSNQSYLNSLEFSSKEACVLSILNNNSVIPKVECKTTLPSTPTNILIENDSIVAQYSPEVQKLSYPLSDCDLRPVTKPFTPEQSITDWCNNPYYLESANYASVLSCLVDLSKKNKLPSVTCKTELIPKNIILDTDNVWKQVYDKKINHAGTPDSICDTSQTKIPITVPNDVTAYCSNPYYLTTNGYATRTECIGDILNNKQNIPQKVPCQISYGDAKYVFREGSWYTAQEPTVNNIGYPPTDCNVGTKFTPYSPPQQIQSYCNNPYYLAENKYPSTIDCIGDILNNLNSKPNNVPCTYMYPESNSNIVKTGDGFIIRYTGAVDKVGFPEDSCQPSTKSTDFVVPINIDKYCNNKYYLAQNGYADYNECVIANYKSTSLPPVECQVGYTGATPSLQKTSDGWALVETPIVINNGYPDCKTSLRYNPYSIPGDILEWCNNPYYRSTSGYNSVDGCISDILNNKNGVLPKVDCSYTYQQTSPPFRKDTDGIWKMGQKQVISEQGYPVGSCNPKTSFTPINIPEEVVAYCSNPYYLNQNGYLTVDGCISDILNNKNNNLPQVDCNISYAPATPQYQVRDGIISSVSTPVILNPGYPTKCVANEKVSPAYIPVNLSDFCNNSYYTNYLGYSSSNDCLLDILNNNKSLPSIPCSYTYEPDTPFIHKESDGNWYKVEIPHVVAKGYPATANCNIDKRRQPYTVDQNILQYCNNNYYLSQAGYINSDKCVEDLVNNLKVFPTISCTGFYRDAVPSFQKVGNSWFKVRTFVPTIQGVPSNNCVVPDEKVEVQIPEYIDGYCSNPYYVKAAGYSNIDECIVDLLNNNVGPKPVPCDLSTVPIAPTYQQDEDGNWVTKKQTVLLRDGYPKNNCDLPVVSESITIPDAVVSYCSNPYFLSYNKFADIDSCINTVMNSRKGILPNVACKTKYNPSTPFYQLSAEGNWTQVFDPVVVNQGYPACNPAKKIVPYDVPETVQSWCNNPYFLRKNGWSDPNVCIGEILNNREGNPPPVECDFTLVDSKPKYSEMDGVIVESKNYIIQNQGFETSCPSGKLSTPAVVSDVVANFCDNPYYRGKSNYNSAISCVLDILNNKDGKPPSVECTYEKMTASPAYDVDSNGNWFINQYQVVKEMGYPEGSCNPSLSRVYVNQTNTPKYPDIVSYCNNPYFLKYNRYADATECIGDILNNKGGDVPAVPCVTKTVDTFYEQQNGTWVKKQIQDIVFGKVGTGECDLSPIINPVDEVEIQKVTDWCSNDYFKSNNLYKSFNNTTECILDLLTNSRDDKGEIKLPTVPCQTELVDTGEYSLINGKWVALKAKRVVNEGFNSDCNIASLFMNIDTNTTQFQAVQDFCNNPYYRDNNRLRPFNDVEECITTIINTNNFQLPDVPCSTITKPASPLYQNINGVVKKVYNRNVEFSKDAVNLSCDTSDIVEDVAVSLIISDYCNNPYFLAYNGYKSTESDQCILDIYNLYEGVPPTVPCKTTTTKATPEFGFITDSDGKRQFVARQSQTVEQQGFGVDTCIDTIINQLRYPSDTVSTLCTNPYYLRSLGYTSNDAQTNYESCVLSQYNTTRTTPLNIPCETSTVPVAKPYVKVNNAINYQTATKVINDGWPLRTNCSNTINNTPYTLPTEIDRFCSNATNNYYWRSNPYYQDPLQGLTFLGSYTGYDHCVLDILNLHHGGNINSPNTSLMKVPCEFTGVDASPKYILDSDNIFKSVKNFNLVKDGYPSGGCSAYNIKTNLNSQNTPNFSVITNFCDNPYWRGQSGYTDYNSCVLSLLNSSTQTPPNVSCTGSILDSVPKVVYNSVTNAYEKSTELKNVQIGYPNSAVCDKGPFKSTLNLTESPYTDLKAYCDNSWYQVQNNFGSANSCVTSILNTYNYPARTITVQPLNKNVTMTQSMVASSSNIVSSPTSGEIQVTFYNAGSPAAVSLLSMKDRLQDWTSGEINFELNVNSFSVGETFFWYFGAGTTLASGIALTFTIASGSVTVQVIAPSGVLSSVSSTVFTTSAWIPVRVVYNPTVTNTITAFANNQPLISASFASISTWITTTSGGYWGFGVKTTSLAGSFIIRRVTAFDPSSLIVAYNNYNNVVSANKPVTIVNNATTFSISLNFGLTTMLSKVVIVPPNSAQGLTAGSVVTITTTETNVNPNPFVATLSSSVQPQYSFYPYTLPVVNCAPPTVASSVFVNVNNNVVKRDTLSYSSTQPSYPTSLCATLNPSPKDTTFTNIDSSLSAYCNNPYYRSANGFASATDCIVNFLNTPNYTLPKVECQTRMSDDGNRYILDTDGWVKQSQALTVLNDGYPANSCWNPSMIQGLVGWYDGDSWNGSQWIDKSGVGNHATVKRGSPTVVNSVLGNGSIKTFKTLAGTINDGIAFPTAILPPKYTLFTVARYTSGDMRRVFDGVNVNWLSGFWRGEVGMSYHLGWITPTYGIQNTTNPTTNWIISSDMNDKYWVNGLLRTTFVENTVSARLSINNGQYTCCNIPEFIPIACNETSNWEVPLVLVFDRKLSDTERQTVESWISDNYGLTLNTSANYISFGGRKATKLVTGSGSSSGLMRKIRLAYPSNQTQWMNLAELKAYDQNGVQLTFATGSSSSVFNPDFVPIKLFDGSNSTIFHSNGDAGGWVEGDLGADKIVGKIVVTNRQDCCQDRAIGLVLTGKNSNDVTTYTANITSAQNEYTFYPIVPPASSCQGMDCTIEGQVCYPGTVGAGNDTLVCKDGRWNKPQDPISTELDTWCNNPYFRQNSLYSTYAECVTDILNNQAGIIPSVSCKTSLTTPKSSTIKEGSNIVYGYKFTDVIVPNRLVSPGGTVFTYRSDAFVNIKDNVGNVAFNGLINNVMVAPPNFPARLTITKNGGLFWKDRVNNIQIVADNVDNSPCQLQLYDNGNLVFSNLNGAVLWELRNIAGYTAVLATPNESSSYKSVQSLDQNAFIPGYDAMLSTNLGYSAKDLALQDTVAYALQKIGGSYNIIINPQRPATAPILPLYVYIPSFSGVPGVTYTVTISASSLFPNAVFSVEAAFGTSALTSVPITTKLGTYTLTFTQPSGGNLIWYKCSQPNLTISSFTIRANPQVLQKGDFEVSAQGQDTPLAIQGKMPLTTNVAVYVFRMECFISTQMSTVPFGILGATKTFSINYANGMMNIALNPTTTLSFTVPIDIWFTLSLVVNFQTAKVFINGVQKASISSVFVFNSFPVPTSWVWATSTMGNTNYPAVLMYGPYIANAPVAIERTARVGNNTVYMVYNDVYTKMVDSNGVAKYYQGQTNLFNPANWDSYTSAGDNYRLHFLGGCMVRNVVWFPNKVISDSDVSKGYCLTQQPEVYHINLYDKTQAQAMAACNARGAKLATIDQVRQAWKDGAQWCSWGHTTTYPSFPMQQGNIAGCNGQNNPSIGEWINFNVNNPSAEWNGGLLGANCYGVKPENGSSQATNVIKFADGISNDWNSPRATDKSTFGPTTLNSQIVSYCKNDFYRNNTYPAAGSDIEKCVMDILNNRGGNINPNPPAVNCAYRDWVNDNPTFIGDTQSSWQTISTLPSSAYAFNNNSTNITTLTNGNYALVFDVNTGLFAIKNTSTNVFTTTFYGPGATSLSPYKLVMQTDGNLVAYDKNNAGVWAGNWFGGLGAWSSSSPQMGTAGQYYLTLQPDGNLVVYSGTTLCWTSNGVKKAEKRDIQTQGYPLGSCTDTTRKSLLSNNNVSGFNDIKTFCSTEYTRNIAYPNQTVNQCILDILNNKGGTIPLVPCDIICAECTSPQVIVDNLPLDVGRANSWAFVDSTLDKTKIPILMLTNPVYTMDMELKINNLGQQCIFDNAGRYPALFVYPANERRLHFVHNPQSAGYGPTTNQQFTQNVWFRFTVVVNVTSIVMYLNGVRDPNIASNVTTPMVNTMSPNWLWNTYNNIGSNNILIRNFRLYQGKAMNDTEVSALTQTSQPSFTNEAGVVKQTDLYRVPYEGTPSYGSCGTGKINPVLISGLVGWYEPDSYKAVGGGTYIWYDKSPKQYNATVPNTNPNISVMTVTNGGKTFTALQGSSTDRVNWNSNILPQTYTLFTVARYSPNGTTRGRIFSGSTNNWLSGFYGGQLGVAYHETSWMTSTVSPNGSDVPTGQTSTNLKPAAPGINDWVLSSDTNDGYWYNGFNRVVNDGAGKSNTQLSINATEPSDWQVAFIAVFNRKLSVSERVNVEAYLADRFGISYAGSTSINSSTKTVKVDAVIPNVVSNFCNNSWQRSQAGYGTNVQQCIADILQNRAGVPVNVVSQGIEYEGADSQSCYKDASGNVRKWYRTSWQNGFLNGSPQNRVINTNGVWSTNATTDTQSTNSMSKPNGSKSLCRSGDYSSSKKNWLNDNNCSCKCSFVPNQGIWCDNDVYGCQCWYPGIYYDWWAPDDGCHAQGAGKDSCSGSVFNYGYTYY